MIAVFVNTVAVLLGSTIGLLCRKGIPERVTKAIMIAIGLCTLYIGVDGALNGSNTLVLILSLVLGTLVGTLLNLDGGLNRFGEWVSNRFKGNGKTGSIAEGLVSATLLFCVGSMTIMGSIEAGLGLPEGREMVYVKSVLDFISSMMFAASMGFGVMLSALCVLVIQGGLALGAGLLAPLLTDEMTRQIVCVGSVILLALGLNMTGATKIKVADMLPAILLAPFLLLGYNWVSGLLGTVL